jgi:murein DD-endopeptidase MepM/ murein hydrolase activator NlpD
MIAFDVLHIQRCRVVESFWIMMIAGITTSPFGLKRFYNGEARRPHTGLDYAGNTGTPVKAPADGRVILIGEYFSPL